MLKEQLEIEDFLREIPGKVLVDVRSPIEYHKGHIPGAINIPLFEDHEREEIGKLYKIRGKEEAVLKGLELVSPKLAGFVKQLKEKTSKAGLLVYCFRGGMRSNSFAWLMRTAGIKTSVLQGGYKRYRNKTLSFYQEKLPLVLLGGFTGSGKTAVLKEISRGMQIIDLEGIASHKGSAFGFINQNKQPSQQQFENKLFEAFSKLNLNSPIWLEDESFCIGSLKLPYELWLQMKAAPIIELKMPIELRVKRLVEEYGTTDKETLIQPLQRIQSRLGGLQTSEALEALDHGNLQRVAKIALSYYDKAYRIDLEKRNFKNVYELNVFEDNPESTAQKCIHFFHQLNLKV